MRNRIRVMQIGNAVNMPMGACVITGINIRSTGIMYELTWLNAEGPHSCWIDEYIVNVHVGNNKESILISFSDNKK